MLNPEEYYAVAQWKETLLPWMTLVIHLFLGVGGSARAEFDFEAVKHLAEKRASEPFVATPSSTNDALLNLSYEAYERIQFRHPRALWRKEGLPFCLEFFLPGFTHKGAVALHEFDEQGEREITFDPLLFDFGTNRLGITNLTSHAGFRVVQSASSAEFAVFLDASYFRMVGIGANYGTSARGLALNTVGNEKEEFPVFEQFWIRKPKRHDTKLTVCALMNSPSVTGAYQFIIRPGISTVAEVKSVVFPRREVHEFGLAPLTSMFLFGKNGRPAFNDFRPEVHDVDGLSIHNGRGEWIWRPLEGGKMTRIDCCQDEGPRGFGLVQRERNFDNYQDLVARFELRPSVWVEPKGNWGKGAVELIQLASDQEYFDNIVAFWRPVEPLTPGHSFEVDYALSWTTNQIGPRELGTVCATRIGRTVGKSPGLRFVIEFGGQVIETLTEQDNVEAITELGGGVQPTIKEVNKNPLNRTCRLVLEVAEPRQSLNLRAFLARNGRPVTETWNYTWQP